MREEHDGRQWSESRVDRGFSLIDIEACAGNLLGLERLDQCLLIHHCPTGGVDEEGSRLHQGQLARPDQMVRGRGEWDMQRHEVRLPKHVGERQM